MSKTYFNPGCALSIYKPEMENKILQFLNNTSCLRQSAYVNNTSYPRQSAFVNKNYGEVTLHKICCHHDPQLEAGSLIINVCAGCDRRFRELYKGISTISIWEVIDGLDTFEYPDYKGLKLSIHDACPVREKPQVHQAVRNLLKKMNIDIVETKFFGTHSICCGDDFYSKLPIEQIHQKMKDRADSMPCDEVCVYCVSCIKSMYIGGKTPRHLMDLLMGETTEPQIYDTVQWHQQLEDYINKH